MSNVLVVLLFAILVVGILFSFQLSMRGDTAKERIARLMPPDNHASLARGKRVGP